MQQKCDMFTMINQQHCFTSVCVYGEDWRLGNASMYTNTRVKDQQKDLYQQSKVLLQYHIGLVSGCTILAYKTFKPLM